MKHLDLVCVSADRDATLERLRSLGVVHLDFSGVAGAGVTAAKGAAADAEKAVRAILKARKELPDEDRRARSVAEVLAILTDAATLAEARDSLERAIRTYEPYGDFDPALAAKLAKEGVTLVLNEDGTFSFDAEGLRVNGAVDAVAHRVTDAPQPPVDAVAHRVPYPEMSLGRMREKLARVVNRWNIDQARLAGCDETAILKSYPALADQIAFESARELMSMQGEVSVISGWIPVSLVSRFTTSAREFGWGVLLRDPAEGEIPPTLIKPPKFVRPVKALFEGLGIAPAYDEADVSVPFMAYFSLFFAMLVGDGAYGVIILLATLFLRKKLVRSWFVLLLVFSLATIVWGALSNTWFGASIPWCADWPTVRWLSGADAPVGHQYDNMMFLCFTIGVTHLMLARIWNGLCKLNSWECLSEFGWAGVVLFMYLLTNTIVGIFPALPNWALGMFGASFFVLFKRAKGMDKGMLFLNTMSVLGDIISYVRLFAVGLASVQVAANFNGMALDLGLPIWIKWLPLVLIMLIGHALNLAMAGLSVLVHAVRLNTLEFSNHKGISWAGYAFRPFCRNAK